MTRAMAEPLARMLDIAFLPLNDDWANRQMQICVRIRASLPAATALFVDHLIANAETRP